MAAVAAVVTKARRERSALRSATSERREARTAAWQRPRRAARDAAPAPSPGGGPAVSNVTGNPRAVATPVAPPVRETRGPRAIREARGPRRLLAALAALTAATALAGCTGASADSHVPRASSAAGSGTGAGPAADAKAPARVVTSAADALVRAGSSLVSTSMRMASGGTWLTITGTGGFDYAGRRGELRLVLPKDAAGAEEHKPITELLMPGALYMKDRGEGVPAGKWVRVDTTRLPDGNLVTGGATDPLAAAELLRGAEDVTYSGEETVGGVKVRHYRGTTDIARAAAAAAPAVRGPLVAASKGFTVTGVPFDAWLDAQGRLRQLTQRFTFSAAGAKQGAGREVTVVSTTRYDGFGAAVPVIMPRAADIWTGKIVSPQAR